MKSGTMFTLRTLTIVGTAIFLGITFNASRPDGLPLVHAQTSAVQLDNATGEINIKDAAMLFISHRAVFVDARDADSYAEGHIQGAVSLPVFSYAQSLATLRSKLTGQTIICYCDGELCHLSQDLAQWLKDDGFANVYVLKNGWTEWQAEKLPVATGPYNAEQ